MKAMPIIAQVHACNRAMTLLKFLAICFGNRLNSREVTSPPFVSEIHVCGLLDEIGKG